MTTMTSAERVGTAMSHQEPDRVPFLLPTIMHGAKELGLTIEAYFAKAEHVIEGQLRLRRKWGHDGLFGFLYAAQEVQAWGGTVVFREDGPPNGGEPPLRAEQIRDLRPPVIAESPVLQRVLAVIRGLAEAAAGEAPVLGVALAPHSLPVLQLGMEEYLNLMFDEPDLHQHLLRINEDFCVSWSNAQLAAGAGAIAYTDPMCSPDMTPSNLARRTAFPSAKRVIRQLNGAAALGLASGRALPIIEDIVATGAVAVSASVKEELATVKKLCRGRLTVMGNLNAIEMRRWTTADAEEAVRTAIRQGAPGGGFVLTDNHGEIPWQVSDDVLLAIADAVRAHGRYPILAREEDHGA